MTRPDRRLDREIVGLAVPALGALVAEPLFLLADTAMVGHLGTTALAGLSLASSVLQTAIGLMVFLAYATTPAVARLRGAGDERGAVTAGVDGLWLAAALGVALALAGWWTTPALVGVFGAEETVADQASRYLSISMAGLPAMLLVFAAAGLLRGLHDTRTPLVVAAAGFAANAALNGALVYGAGWGIAGSAAGTVLAQWGMVGAYLWVITRHARRVGASGRPRRVGILSGARAGSWLFLRTLSLRVALLLVTYVAAALGSDELAALQIGMTLFATAAFALDALAIAAQVLVGARLGAGDVAAARVVLRRCVAWGVAGGVVVGAVFAALAWVIGPAFTSAEEVAGLVTPAVLVLAVTAPLAGLVFVLDGVLIGAGDNRYLAWTGLINLAAFAVLAGAVLLWAPGGRAGVGYLMGAFAGGFLAARAVTLSLRVRGSGWLVVGAER
ncbi:MATE family efflux transporter [Frankia sp. CNm7]|uniref:MATE family efflux transporter n=1 Tax=Frankia nepalensis TaxID=1836974 RepID=UPI001D37C102|nr:MATE family efflux transporter [Frankia nepalensis]MBL7500613.1 MATE family efflux transporter [Frankia nepalensis]MBL7510986.1 MATE family efflux transporter [Frankia nepalensis]MBL7518485.1 MATE family efflux transporter [Frankia nepalensis]